MTKTPDDSTLSKEAEYINPALGPLLLRGVDTVAIAVSELSNVATAIGDTAAEEIRILKDRTKYFIGVIVALVALTIALGFVGYELISTGSARSEQIRIIDINQLCAVRVNNRGFDTAAEAESAYNTCKRTNGA